MNIRKLFLFILIFSLSVSVFSQEAEEAENEEVFVEEEVNIKGKDFETSENFVDFIHSLDYVLNLGPYFYLNTQSTLVSAPSPIEYPVSMGILWPNYTFVAMQPDVSISYMYYLWYDGMALPAEVENRTSLAIMIQADLPVVFQLYMKRSRFQISVGPSVLARIGLMAPAVKDNDSGYSGSADSDLKLINSWFWKKGRFMYLYTGFSWLYSLNEEGTVKFGPEIKAYFPIGGIINGEKFQGFMLEAGMKISL